MPARSLQTVWVTSGSLCGTVSGLVHEQLVGTDGSRGVPGPGLGQVQHRGPCRTRVHVGRYLAPVKARTPIRGRATTRPGSLLRNSITIHKAGDEVETEPGFFEIDTLAHCVPTLKGEFCRTVNFTDMYTGWVFTRSIRNNAHVHILGVLDRFSFAVTGIDCDNGSEFINHDLISWAGHREVFFTRSRPYKKND